MRHRWDLGPALVAASQSLVALSDRVSTLQPVFLALDALADQFAELICVLLTRACLAGQHWDMLILNPALRVVEQRSHAQRARRHRNPFRRKGWVAAPIPGAHAKHGEIKLDYVHALQELHLLDGLHAQ